MLRPVRRVLAFLGLAALAGRPAHAQHGGHGQHGNPEDLDAYIAKMEDPSRDAWQKPEEVIAALKGIANIDFEKRPTPVGPPVEHRVAREDFLAAAQKTGLRVVAEPKILPHQYFIILQP